VVCKVCALHDSHDGHHGEAETETSADAASTSGGGDISGRSGLGDGRGRGDDRGRDLDARLLGLLGGLLDGSLGLLDIGNLRSLLTRDLRLAGLARLLNGDLGLLRAASLLGRSGHGDLRNRDLGLDDSDGAAALDGGAIGDAGNGDGGINNDGGVDGGGDDGSAGDSDARGDRLTTSDDGRVLRDLRSADTLESLDSLGNDVVGLTVGVDALVDLVDQIGVLAVALLVKAVLALAEDGNPGVQAARDNLGAVRAILFRLLRLLGCLVNRLLGLILIRDLRDAGGLNGLFGNGGGLNRLFRDGGGLDGLFGNGGSLHGFLRGLVVVVSGRRSRARSGRGVGLVNRRRSDLIIRAARLARGAVIIGLLRLGAVLLARSALIVGLLRSTGAVGFARSALIVGGTRAARLTRLALIIRSTGAARLTRLALIVRGTGAAGHARLAVIVAIEVDVVPVDLALLALLGLVVELDLLGTTTLLVVEVVLALSTSLGGSAALAATGHLELHLHITLLLTIDLELGHREVLGSIIGANLDVRLETRTAVGGEELGSWEGSAHDITAADLLAARPLATSVLKAIMFLVVELLAGKQTTVSETTLVLGQANVVNVLGAFVGLSAEELLSTESKRSGDLSEASGGHQDEGVLHGEVGVVVCICCCLASVVCVQEK
jgi:hypothetical protein